MEQGSNLVRLILNSLGVIEVQLLDVFHPILKKYKRYADLIVAITSCLNSIVGMVAGYYTQHMRLKSNWERWLRLMSLLLLQAAI